MRHYYRHTTNWHIVPKIVISLIAIAIFAYPTYEIADHNLMFTIWATLLTLSIPLGIMYAEWYD